MANGALGQGMAPQEQQGGGGQMQPSEMMPEMQGEENPNLYPADKKEVISFASSIIEMLYADEATLKQMVQSIAQANTIEEGISQVVAMLLSKVLTSIQKKTGRDINVSFVDDIVIMLISEMYVILKAAGEINVPPNKNTLPETVNSTMEQLQGMLQRGMQVEQQQAEMEAQGGQPQPQGPPQPSALGA